ncbi:MAG: hypothetical protein QG646_1890 [Euryarchaeota archaeon]|nr:hypothetical protein [Euryarchaeota archaeon]
MRIKMKAFNKIIFLGVALFILSSIFSTLTCLTDTYAYFDDTKNVDVNLTAAIRDSEGTLIGLSDYKLPADDEKLNGATFVTRENPKASETGNKSVNENSSNHRSSVNYLMSDFSVEGNNTTNLTTNNSTSADGNSRDSLDSSTVPEQTSSSSVLPVANFSSNVTSGYSPFFVQFIDLSKNTTKWNWDFGDGNYSTVKNPAHTYSAPESYIVTLTASNENGTNSTFFTITVLQTVLPVANFSSNITNGYASLSVQFTDLSENATVWNWDFGDGNYSTVKNPMHIYSAAGNYTVNLTATNAAYQSTKTCEISINRKFCNKRDLSKQKTL